MSRDGTFQVEVSPAYLRGIETSRARNAWFRNPGSPAYLRGIETVYFGDEEGADSGRLQPT